MNTLNKVLSFLREVSKGYKIVTVGSSAGGYAAVLFGTLLEAERVFAFSPQFDLTDWLKSRKLQDTEAFVNQKEYINIVDILKNSRTDIFYFFPAYVEADICQAELVKDIPSVHTFGIKSKLHGKALYPNCIPEVLASDVGRLKKMEKAFQNKTVSPFSFALFVCGIKTAIIGKCYEIAKANFYILNDFRRKYRHRKTKK